MGQRLPICDAKDVIRVLRRHGFVKVGQKGSHLDCGGSTPLLVSLAIS